MFAHNENNIHPKELESLRVHKFQVNKLLTDLNQDELRNQCQIHFNTILGDAKMLGKAKNKESVIKNIAAGCDELMAALDKCQGVSLDAAGQDKVNQAKGFVTEFKSKHGDAAVLESSADVEEKKSFHASK